MKELGPVIEKEWFCTEKMRTCFKGDPAKKQSSQAVLN